MCSLWCRCSGLYLALNYDTENTAGLVSPAAIVEEMRHFLTCCKKQSISWLACEITAFQRWFYRQNVPAVWMFNSCSCLLRTNCNRSATDAISAALQPKKLPINRWPRQCLHGDEFPLGWICWILAIFSQRRPDTTRRCCVGGHLASLSVISILKWARVTIWLVLPQQWEHPACLITSEKSQWSPGTRGGHQNRDLTAPDRSCQRAGPEPCRAVL